MVTASSRTSEDMGKRDFIQSGDAPQQGGAGQSAPAWAVLLICFLVGLCRPAAAADSASEEAPTVRKAVTAASEYDYPPYCVLTEDGRADGFSVELLRAALAAMDREVTFTLGPWSEVRQKLEEGTVQVLPLVGRTPEREEIFDFTFPYLTMHGAIVVREDTRDIRSLADLAGRRVAVMRGDNAEEFARRIGLDADIAATTTFEEALRQLAAGRHDAVIIQRLVALQLMKQGGLNNLRLVGPPLTDFVQSFCFAVREGDKELLGLLNEGLSLVIADGTFRRLYAKWFASIEAGRRERSRIVVGVDKDYPPFEYLDENGEAAGYNVDLTRAIARHVGLDVTFRTAAWSEIREALARDEVDVVQGMLYSVERDATFDFSPAHAVVSNSIVVRQGRTMPRTLADLHELSILAVRGDIMHDAAVEQGLGEQLILVGSADEALRRLAAGEGDCALVAKVQAHYWIQRRDWTNLQVSQHSVRSPEYCYAVPAGKEWLLTLFSEGLADLKASGEYREIYARWLGPYEKAEISMGEILRRFFWLALLAVLVLAGILLWSWSLRETVRRRTAELRREVIARKRREVEIQTKNAELERFAYTISHDFKGPLVTLQTFLGFLERDLKEGVQEQVDKDLFFMRTATERMSRLLRDLSELLRIGKLASTGGVIPFRAVVDEALSLAAGAISEHEVAVQVDASPLALQGDRSRLLVIWQNLIDNAIKYRSPERPACLEIGFETASTGPIFHVSDNGIGIDVRHREKIFGLFDQLDPRSDGSGLGLALVRQIVEMYGGEIWVESNSHVPGSRFRFTLPAAISPQGGS